VLNTACEVVSKPQIVPKIKVRTDEKAQAYEKWLKPLLKVCEHFQQERGVKEPHGPARNAAIGQQPSGIR
jgi:hypothetical protein